MEPFASDAAHPPPREGDWTVRDFRFHNGDVLPELRLHYVTVGEPAGKPVLVLHGTVNTAAGMLSPAFAGQLFGPGQPLDAARHYIVIPDSIGLGRSSKPSDGLRTRFPRYGYDDMVNAQHRLLTEHLGIRHLHLVIGNSMGGMHAWLWGVRYPDFMDALVPMAAQPAPVAGRNQLMRRLAIEIVRRDPDYRNGDYTRQPRSLNIADAVLRIGFSGGEMALDQLAPTCEAADATVGERLTAPTGMDANDYIWRFDASRDYDPAPHLERIEAHVLAINSADDERNPPQNGVMERALERMRNARLHLIPASAATAGHGTTANAKFYAEELRAFLRTVPARTPSGSIGMTRNDRRRDPHA